MARPLRARQKAVEAANRAIRYHVEVFPHPWTPEQQNLYSVLLDAYVSAVAARDQVLRADARLELMA